MAIESTDLFVVQRPSNKQHYKLNLSTLISQVPSDLPVGRDEGDLLIWDSADGEWKPGAHIDCGTY